MKQIIKYIKEFIRHYKLKLRYYRCKQIAEDLVSLGHDNGDAQIYIDNAKDNLCDVMLIFKNKMEKL